MKSTNDLLRDLRVDKDLKQSDVAAMLNISQQQYSRYETDSSELPLRALIALADYYGVSADFLTGRTACRENVDALGKKVSADCTAGEVISDILSLGAAGRAAVVEYVEMRKMKEVCEKKKEKDGPRR